VLDAHIDSLFARIAVLLMLAAIAGGLATLLRQPLIVAYIAVGMIAGPAVLGITGHQPEISLLADLGIAVLLFLVGLRLDLTLVRRMGAVAAATGLGQVFVTSVVGFGLCLLLGIDIVPSIYIAVALTFSSTIIIVKLLTDKREIDSLHGRIAVGFLIVQDLVVVIAMIVLSAIAAAGVGADAAAADRLRETVLAVVGVVVKGVVLLGAIGALMRWVLPWLATRLATSMELLVLSGVAWGVLLSAACEQMGFSREVGAFLAGVSLASTPFRDALGGRLASLRDFLLLFFFIRLGGELDLGGVGAQLVPALVLSLFVLIGNPLISWRSWA